MNRPTHLGQRYPVVQVTKYCQHGKALETGAEPATPHTEDIYRCIVEKLAARISFPSRSAECIIVTVISEKGKEISIKIDVFATTVLSND